MRSEKYHRKPAYYESLDTYSSQSSRKLFDSYHPYWHYKISWLTFLGQRISCLDMAKNISFRYFKTITEIIQFAFILDVRFPLSLRNEEHLPHERGVDVSYESVRYRWHRFGFKKALDKLVNVDQLRSFSGM